MQRYLFALVVIFAATAAFSQYSSQDPVLEEDTATATSIDQQGTRDDAGLTPSVSQTPHVVDLNGQESKGPKLNVVNLECEANQKNPYSKGTAITAVGVALALTGVLNFFLAEAFPAENKPLFYTEGGIRCGVGFFMIIGGAAKTATYMKWEREHRDRN